MHTQTHPSRYSKFPRTAPRWVKVWPYGKLSHLPEQSQNRQPVGWNWCADVLQNVINPNFLSVLKKCWVSHIHFPLVLKRLHPAKTRTGTLTNCFAFTISFIPQVKPTCPLQGRKLRTREETRDRPRLQSTTGHTQASNPGDLAPNAPLSGGKAGSRP